MESFHQIAGDTPDNSHTHFSVKTLLTTLLAAWLLALPVWAQTLQTLYYFTNGPAYPSSPLVQGLDGNFYGTTYQGGSADIGTVFKMTTNGGDHARQLYLGQWGESAGRADVRQRWQFLRHDIIWRQRWWLDF